MSALDSNEILDENLLGAKLNYKYAGFWIRFVAFFVDGIIIGIPMYIALFTFVRASESAGNSALSGFLALMVFIMVIAGPWLYFALMHCSKNQATLGKMMAGIQVVDLQYKRISFGRATGRFFSLILSRMILYIGYIMAAFDSQKQALHDKIAGTYVVYKMTS
ncbi:MAG: RDD family protein [Bacteroidales bacterium]|nr:RDD family protein [Bacteroidales bacterium]